jgi:pimeloyl-ACP methyl ester carboxylesterase
MVARRVALAHPDRLSGLILMDTSAGPPPGLDPELIAFGVEIVKEHGMGELKRVQDELDPLGSPSYRRLLAERPGYREYAEYRWTSLSPVMWMRLAVEIVTQPDQLADVADLELPTLVIVGDEDATFIEPCRQLAATVPGAGLAVIPGAGHSPQFENPPAWFAALHDFLADLPTPTPNLRR